MSVTRWSDDSEVYVFESDKGWECHCCKRNGGETHIEHSVPAMIAHLNEHLAAGGKVPAIALDPENYKF